MFVITFFTFMLFSFQAFKFTQYVNHKIRNINKLTIFDNKNDYNMFSDRFVYIISHHYYCDDYNYPSYHDLHRIYQTDKEAFQKIYNTYSDEDEYHFKVVKYRMNQIDEDDQFSEVLYDSYKHIINENLQVTKREILKKEEYPQVRRLYYWALTEEEKEKKRKNSLRFYKSI